MSSTSNLYHLKQLLNIAPQCSATTTQRTRCLSRISLYYVNTLLRELAGKDLAEIKLSELQLLAEHCVCYRYHEEQAPAVAVAWYKSLRAAVAFRDDHVESKAKEQSLELKALRDRHTSEIQDLRIEHARKVNEARDELKRSRTRIEELEKSDGDHRRMIRELTNLIERLHVATPVVQKSEGAQKPEADHGGNLVKAEQDDGDGDGDGDDDGDGVDDGVDDGDGDGDGDGDDDDEVSEESIEAPVEESTVERRTWAQWARSFV